MKNVVVTGYKSFELNIFDENDKRIKFIKEALRRRLINWINEGLEWVLISGQLGIELWCGEIVLQLQEEGYDLKLAVIPPFKNQSKRWNDVQQEKYEQICFEADFYQLLYKDEYKGAHQYQVKNKWFLDKSDGCIIVMDEEQKGSTSYFYNLARSKESLGQYTIDIITPYDLEEIVSDLTTFYD